jgi:Arc/MetJ-type ribon-helix-helix transcriptional regulator
MEEKQTTRIQADVPASLFSQAQKLVDAGWFSSIDEMVLDALRRFLDSHRQELIEDFIKEDVKWGLNGDE